MKQKKPKPSEKIIQFNIFRYQLLVPQNIQLSIDLPDLTIEDIRNNKNKKFKEILLDKKFKFITSKSESTSKIVYEEGDLIIFKVAAKRSIKRSKKDFTEEDIDNWPSVIIAINNNPDIQKIAIQENYHAFPKTDPVVNILRESFNSQLKNHNLNFYVDPLFDKKEFWEIVKTYNGQITQIKFELISPNLANISRGLQIDLKQLNADSNTQRTNLELNSGEASALVINEDSGLIGSIVDYSAEGGGNITLKVQGVKKKIHTRKTKKEISINEIEIKTNNWAVISNTLKDLLG